MYFECAVEILNWVFSVLILHPNLVVTAPQVSAVAARCASKKSGTSPKNKGGHRVGKRYGWKKLDGRSICLLSCFQLAFHQLTPCQGVLMGHY